MNAARSEPMLNWSAGEYGGVFAGLVAALVAIGKAAAWVLGWNDRRQRREDERLKAWEASLTTRERDYRLQIETQLAETHDLVTKQSGEIDALRSKLRSFGGTLIEVMIELKDHAPTSMTLRRAVEALRDEFPVDFNLPGDLARLAQKIGKDE